jgi:hypothetical protein
MILAVWTTACLTALFALRKRVAPALLSPVILVAMSMLLLMAGGVLLYQDVALAQGGAGVQLVISDALVERTAQLLLLSTSAFLVGAALGLARKPATRPRIPSARLRLPPVTLSILAAACALPIVYDLATSGIGHLLDRPLYISDAFGGGSVAIADQLAVAAVVVLGYLAGTWRGAGRAVAVTLAGLYGVLFFAGGSRRLALAPLLFALGIYAAAPGRRSRAGLVVAAGASLYLIPLPLFLRDQARHGLLPYHDRLPAVLLDTSGWDEVGRNVLISFAIIGVTAYVQPHMPLHDLGVSLNPLPGRLVGWYDVAPLHRLNDYTPYGAVGELGNAGSWAVIGYFFVIGLIMAHLDRRVRSLLMNGRTAHALLIVGLVGLFCLFNQQYNLRQSTRMVYYALALDFALIATAWLFSRSRYTDPPRETPQLLEHERDPTSEPAGSPPEVQLSRRGRDGQVPYGPP